MHDGAPLVYHDIGCSLHITKHNNHFVIIRAFVMSLNTAIHDSPYTQYGLQSCQIAVQRITQQGLS